MSSNNGEIFDKGKIIEKLKKSTLGWVVIILCVICGALVWLLAVAADFTQVFGCTVSDCTGTVTTTTTSTTTGTTTTTSEYICILTTPPDDTTTTTPPVSEPTAPPVSEPTIPANYYDSSRSYKEGDLFTFGRIEQDGDLSNGEEYIEWRVIDKEYDEMLVIAEHGLAYRRMNSVFSETWADSELRSWLNGDFYYDCFSDTEHRYMLESTLQNPDHPDHGTDSGVNTKDCIFVLNSVEYYTMSRNYYRCTPTDYAFSQCEDAYAGGMNGDSWWLRTVGSDDDFMLVVKKDGAITTKGVQMNKDNVMVRPAMRMYVNG